jgi:hypothetical protein
LREMQAHADFFQLGIPAGAGQHLLGHGDDSYL